MRKGKRFLIVGASGNGKSTILKKLIRPVHSNRLFVYDVQGEYFEDEDLPDIDEFLVAMEKKTDTVQVYEEATIFFSNRGSNKLMRKILVSARHDRNVIFLVFHSIRSIPLYIYDLIDTIIVFNTNDNEDIVQSKHPTLLEAWRKVKGKKYVYEVVKIN